MESCSTTPEMGAFMSVSMDFCCALTSSWDSSFCFSSALSRSLSTPDMYWEREASRSRSRAPAWAPIAEGEPCCRATRRATSSLACIRSWATRSRSDWASVGSSSTRVWPAATWSPSWTWMALITPGSSGWITFTLPAGSTRPLALARMSTWPRKAQAMATTKKVTMSRASARPVGEGGVSSTSSAAGRNSRSRPRSGRPMALDSRSTRLMAQALSSSREAADASPDCRLHRCA